MDKRDLIMKKGNNKVCSVCHKMLDKKQTTFEGRKFCCRYCCNMYKKDKKAKKQRVCTHC